ncbi:cell division protein FtsQ/DivIB [Ornithinimicrobium sediminis]|uniref:cell division protein FtsQ/DivIB n=1 Tax=Ornithinimicrobium sediminis TaxID=2904603 RepID=UPI001E49F6FF|nr:FtsQ-type POTRA domain-containing protein [Ornithinimicrobium sediminis]MCE0488193.1 FtsQ-type POTRA domain-containing protein [Ornithinimicrobium sediminis]
MSTGVRSRPRTGSTPAAPVSVPVHDRFTARARRIRRRPLRLVGWLVAVLVLVGAVVGVLLWSPAFVVEDVVVEGAEGQLAEGAVSRAAIPVGLQLARVDTEAVAARVEEDLRIAEATVGRDWPSTVSLTVRLREPALVLDQAGAGSLQLVDAEGVVYDTVSRRPDDVPRVRAPRGDVSPASLAGTLDMQAALTPETAEQVRGLQVLGDGELRFAVGPVTVLWGGPEDAELKARVLEALLAQEPIALALEADADAEGDAEGGGEDGPALTIDVAVPGTPVVSGLEPSLP